MKLLLTINLLLAILLSITLIESFIVDIMNRDTKYEKLRFYLIWIVSLLWSSFYYLNLITL